MRIHIYAERIRPPVDSNYDVVAEFRREGWPRFLSKSAVSLYLAIENLREQKGIYKWGPIFASWEQLAFEIGGGTRRVPDWLRELEKHKLISVAVPRKVDQLKGFSTIIKQTVPVPPIPHHIKYGEVEE